MTGDWDKPPWEDEPFQPAWLQEKIAQEVIKQERAYRQDRQMMQEEFSKLVRNGTRPQSNGNGVFTRFSLPAAPKVEVYIIQYIGGAKNSEQEYRFPGDVIPQRGKRFAVTVDHKDKDGDPGFDIFYYLPTYIPMAETPFATNAQIIIALFQEG